MASCSICKPVHLPLEVIKSLTFLPLSKVKGDYYASFDELYGIPMKKIDHHSEMCKSKRSMEFHLAHGKLQ